MGEELYITGIPSKKRNLKIWRFLLGNKAVLRDSAKLYYAKKNQVNINAWVNDNCKVNNIGDVLSVVIVEYMCQAFGIDINKQTNGTRHLYAIDSILLGFQDAVIWGSGFGYDVKKPTIVFKGLLHKLRHKTDIRAIRGPESLRILKSMKYPPRLRTNISFGDPAILLPLFYKGNPQKRVRYRVIPHYSLFYRYSNVENVMSTFTSDWKVFVDMLLEAELIISSSLHGIIIAEAYGIPAVMLNDTVSTDITKYKDWYYSTDRYDFPMANSIEEALTITPSKISRSLLKKMQQDLINSFPKDLWNG